MVDLDLQQAFFLRPLEDGVVEGGFEKLGEDGEDVDVHAGAEVKRNNSAANLQKFRTSRLFSIFPC